MRVRHSVRHVEELAALTAFLERTKGQLLFCSWNNIVMCSCQGCPAKGILLSQGGVLVSSFDGLMHSMMPVITEDPLDQELNSTECHACVCVWVHVHACVCVCTFNQ